MEKLVKFIISELVEKKDAINVTIDGSVIKVSVAKEDMGKIIGRQGRTAKAIRTIIKAASTKTDVKYTLEILD